MIVLCRVSEIPETGIMPASAPGLPELLICRVNNEIHVLSNLCSHGDSALSEGRLLGCEIECELHQGRFDVRTGKATRRPAKKPIERFEARVVDDMVVLVDSTADPEPAHR